MTRRTFLELLTGAGLAWSVPGRFAGADKTAKPVTALAYDPLYLEHWLHEGHPESPERLRAVMAQLQRRGITGRLQQLSPLSGIESDIYRIHSREHVQSISRHYGHSHKVAAAVVGGVLAATDAVGAGNVKNAFCATRPPGHHATSTGKVEGFCFYNSVAIAARYAQEKYKFRKILIVDWDYHHGNGTESAFYSDPTILFFSTHDYYAYPGTGDPSKSGEGRGKGYNINVHLDCGASDADIIRAFREKLIPTANKFRPELILISAGFDSRKDDLLGCFDITDQGFITMTEMMMSLADRHCDGRLVSILEGGYNPAGLASGVVAHVTALNNYTGN